MSVLGDVKSAAAGCVVWDRGERESVKGLHARVSVAGRRSWLVYYRTRTGQQRRPALGEFPAVSLGEARRRATQILAQVALGQDPKGEWDQGRRAARRPAEMTLGELWDRVHREHWAPQKTTWARDVGYYWAREIEPALGRLPLSQVTRSRLRAWHAGLADKPVAANRALRVLSKMFNWAIDREIVQGPNPCARLALNTEKKRGRYASPDELARIGAALDAEAVGNPHAVAFLRLLIFTGSRPSLIARARWEHLTTMDVDGQVHGLLRLPGKSSNVTGEDETVVLPPEAMRVLEQLPRLKGQTITGLAGTPIRVWERVRTMAGCQDLWARDLRRTFATVGLSGGVALGVVGELLNHQTAQTTKRYAKLIPTERVAAAGAIAARVDALLGGAAAASPARQADVDPRPAAPIGQVHHVVDADGGREDEEAPAQAAPQPVAADLQGGADPAGQLELEAPVEPAAAALESAPGAEVESPPWRTTMRVESPGLGVLQIGADGSPEWSTPGLVAHRDPLQLGGARGGWPTDGD